MTITSVHRAIKLKDCRLFLCVNGRPGLLARSQALFLIDGVLFEDADCKMLMPSATLFDISPNPAFPFEKAATEIISGGHVSFDIACTLVGRRRELKAAFIDCIPKSPMGLYTARDRWTFAVAPDVSVWEFILESNGGGNICR